jgi:dolichol-phosphate mannosyltransferase
MALMMLSRRKAKRFFIAGLVAALVNFLALVFFVEVLGFRTFLLKNVANLMAMEIAVIFHFFLSRHWTWQRIPRKKGRELVTQALSFHAAVFAGISLRIILFAVLEKWNVHYLFNNALGIGLVAVMNYVFFDKFIFREAVETVAHTEG